MANVGNRCRAGRHLVVSMLSFVLCASTLGEAARAELRITEVMPKGTGVLDEWIEFINIGTDPVDLSAYRVGDEEVVGDGEGFYAFPAVTIEAGEIIIVARNATAFAAAFTPAAGTRIFASSAAAAGFALTKDTALGTGEIGLGNGTSSTGDEVLLLKKTGDGIYVLVDGMSYGGTNAVTSYTPPGGVATTFIDVRVTSLPSEDLGSIARISASVDTNAAADWTALAAATPGTAPLNICGNAVVESGETCDDGNDDSDDGCAASCQTECGFTCVGTGPASCGEDCGDGDVAGLEECDDGDALPGDGCDESCHIEAGFACPEPEPLCDNLPGTASVCVLDPCALPLLITEVHADGLVDSGSEWIELTNTGALAIDLSSWSFGDQTTQGAAVEGSIRFGQGMTLAAGKSIVIANNGTTFQSGFGAVANYEYGTDSAATAPYLHRTSDWSPNTNIQLDNGSDQVVLTCAGFVRDILRWGPPPTDGLTVPAPSADYSAANPTTGPLTFERLANAKSGTAADWSISRCPSPGLAPNPNSPPESAAALVTVAAGVATTFSLSAFDPDADALTFTLDTTGTVGTVVDLGDGLVRYTPPAGPGPLTTSFKFTAADECSTSTPATVDVVVGSAACDPKLTSVRITEVHADARVDNDGEWIELSNPTNAAIDLGFLRVGDEESQGGPEGMVVFRQGTMLAANDAVVVAFSANAFRSDWDLLADREWYRDSDGIDNELPRALAWSEGPIRLDNSADGVLLLGCTGAVIDAVYWGNETPSGTPAETPWADRVRANPPWDGLSSAGPATFARRDPTIDTNSAADWFRERCPTPGEPRSNKAAPTTTDAIKALASGTTLSDTFGASDPDSPSLTYSATVSAGAITVNASTGTYTFTPPAGAGTYTILFDVSDGCGIAGGTVSVCVASNPATCDLACSPDKPDLCDGLDNDCNPATADGAGDPAVGVPCDSPLDADLCADELRACVDGKLACPNNAVGDANRVEFCDTANVDEDCDGGADDLDPQANATGKQTFYRDLDADGRGKSSATQLRCDAGGGYVAQGGDCDDDPAACGNRCSPDISEARSVGNCNDNRDNDCDGATDTDPSCGEDILCYLDRDKDGFGRFSSETVVSGPAAERGCTGYNDGVNPAGSWVANGLDCDDDPSGCGAGCNPDEVEVCDDQDNDCDPSTADGSGDPSVSAACDASADSDLCLDDRASCQAGTVVCINIATNDAAQIEVCDPPGLPGPRDEDCDGGANDNDPQGPPTTAPFWYRDQDGDGFGSAASAIRACVPPAGYVSAAGDCDDAPATCGAACYPGAPDICDGKDNDCDAGTVDGAADVLVGAACDSDADADGCLDEISVCASGRVTCPNDPEGDTTRIEVCDPNDNDEDCDGGADDADPDGHPPGAIAWYADRDGDGHGDPATETIACDGPTDYISVAGDCDDDPAGCGARCNADRDESATADGACSDGFDNDCDGLTDTDPGCAGGTRCYADRDQDGFGDDLTFTTIPPAEVPAGGCAAWDDGSHAVGHWTATTGDCSDEAPDINPDASEIVGNDRDEDCNGAVRCWVDEDNDNFASDTAAEGDAAPGQTCDDAFHLASLRGDCDDLPDGCGAGCSPAASEICDQRDNDCDDRIDEGDACGPELIGVVGGGEGCASGSATSLLALGVALAALVLLRRRTV